MDFKYSKQQLIDALEARRQWAEKLDEKQAAKHKRDEAAALKRWHSELREKKVQALKKISEGLSMNYEQAKNSETWRYGRDIRLPSIDRPSCPQSVAKQLDGEIKWVTMDGRKSYTISKHGRFSTLHYLLTYDENAKPDVCK